MTSLQSQIITFNAVKIKKNIKLNPECQESVKVSRLKLRTKGIKTTEVNPSPG